MFWFLGHEACVILAPWPGIKPAPPALEGEVLTTGPPEKSQQLFIEYLPCALFYTLELQLWTNFLLGVTGNKYRLDSDEKKNKMGGGGRKYMEEQ